MEKEAFCNVSILYVMLLNNKYYVLNSRNVRNHIYGNSHIELQPSATGDEDPSVDGDTTKLQRQQTKDLSFEVL